MHVNMKQILFIKKGEIPFSNFNTFLKMLVLYKFSAWNL